MQIQECVFICFQLKCNFAAETDWLCVADLTLSYLSDLTESTNAMQDSIKARERSVILTDKTVLMSCQSQLRIASTQWQNIFSGEICVETIQVCTNTVRIADACGGNVLLIWELH